MRGIRPVEVPRYFIVLFSAVHLHQLTVHSCNDIGHLTAESLGLCNSHMFMQGVGSYHATPRNRRK